MIELTTEFLRMWLHCPLQAALCAKHSVRPADVVARRAITEALGAASPDGRSPRFKSDRVAKEFDRHWTDYQTRWNTMDLATFYALGAKMQSRATAIAGVINRAIDEGWSYVDGAHELLLPLEQHLGEIAKGVRLAHQVDCLMRDPSRTLYLVSFSITSTMRYANLREINHALDIQLNNLAGRLCLNEPCRAAVISINSSRLLAATNDPSDIVRALGWTRNTLESIKYSGVPHRPISELNCGYCPVQSLCDDPHVYDTIHREGVTVL